MAGPGPAYTEARGHASNMRDERGTWMTSGDEQNETARSGWRIPSRWPVIVGSALVLAGLVAGVSYVIAGSGTGPAAPRAANAIRPGPDATGPVPQFRVPAGVNPVALPSTGAAPLPLPATEQPQLTSWEAGAGGVALRAISTEASTAAQAGGLKEYTAMRAACTKLASSVRAARAAPPIPDTAMQQAYSAALSRMGQAAAECQAAISEKTDGDEYIATTENKSALHAAQTALASAARELFRATGALTR